MLPSHLGHEGEPYMVIEEKEVNEMEALETVILARDETSKTTRI